MKILLLYTPRSGSTSIFNYFNKIKTDYKNLNYPFRFSHSKSDSVLEYDNNISLNSLIEYDNLFIKNNIFIFLKDNQHVINYFKSGGISMGDFSKCPSSEDLESFFDKIIILTRKNFKEQAESWVYSSNISSTTNTNMYHQKIKYNIDVDSLNSKEVKKVEELYKIYSNIIETKLKNKYKVFYYEDLYLNNNFDDLFTELDIKYDNINFNYFLDIKNKYRLSNQKNIIKKNSTLL